MQRQAVFVDFNENAMRFFGLDQESLLKVGPIELSPPNSYLKVLKRFRKPWTVARPSLSGFIATRRARIFIARSV